MNYGHKPEPRHLSFQGTRLEAAAQVIICQILVLGFLHHQALAAALQIHNPEFPEDS